jgi:hypothetical protein
MIKKEFDKWIGGRVKEKKRAEECTSRRDSLLWKEPEYIGYCFELLRKMLRRTTRRIARNRRKASYIGNGGCMYEERLK